MASIIHNVSTSNNIIVKSVIVGTPVAGVTSGAFNISSLGGVSTAGAVSGNLLIYNASTTQWETAEFDSGEGINLSWDSDANTWTISAELASSSNAGVASFSSDDFTVDGSGGVTINFSSLPESLIPAADSAYDLGSADKQWRSLYLSGSTIFLGGQSISYDSDTGSLQFNGDKVITDNASITTDDLNEGSTNLFFTDARARSAISASGDLSYDSSTGTFSIDVEVEYTKANFDSDFNTAIDSATTSDLSEGNNLYYTSTRVDSDIDGRVTKTFVDNLNVDADTLDGIDASSFLRSDTADTASGTITFADIIVNGNLTVAGTTTSINTEEIKLADNIITLNSNFDSGSPTENAGIEVLRGDDNTVSIQWNETADKWYVESDGTGTIVAGTFEGNITGNVTGQVSDISNHSTTDLSEGNNLYYTTARADSDAKNAVSATDAGGDGSFSYNAGTGIFTYTGPSATEVRAHINASGDPIDYNSTTGTISWTGNTDDVTEGSTNLYYTTARADSDAKNAVSATDAGGDGSFSYNAGTGVFTYTGPSASEARAHFSAAGDLTYNSGTGEFSYTDSDRTPAQIKGLFSGAGDISYNSATGEFSYTDSDRTPTQIRGLFSAAGDLTYNSGTGEFSIDVENVYTKANFDSDFNVAIDSATTSDLSEGNNLYYTTVRADSDFDVRLATKSTTDVAEGNNLYYTTVRADSDAKNAVSAVDAGGDGSFTYNSGTGVFTYTGPSASEVRAHFSAGGDLTYNSGTGEFSYTDSDRTPTQIRGLFSGAGDISYNSATGEISYTDSDRTPAQIRGLFSGSGNISYNSSTGQFSYTDSDRTPTQIRGLFSGAGDISYNSSTGEFSYTDSDRSPAQIRGLFTAAGDLSYNNTTGEFSYTDSDRTPAQIRGLFSVTDAGGDGSLSYNNTSGVITYTGPSAAEVRAHFSGGTGVTITDGSVAIGQSVGTSDDVTFAKVTVDSAEVDGIQFATTIGHPSYDEGKVWYDNIHKTLNYYSDDSAVIHELGIEEHQRVYNNTGSTITKGSPLYFSGNYNPGGGAVPVPTVGLADATDENAYNAQGIAASDIANGSYGYCIVAGQLDEFDTSGLTAGQNVFVGLSPGTLQNVAPSYPNYPMCIGWVVKSDATDGVILVNQQNHSVPSFRVRTSAHIGTDLRVDGNLTVVGSQTITSTENISIGGAINYLNAGNTIGEAGTTFVGTGLDDAFFEGHYSGDSATKSFFVKIDATGTPDTFEWGFDSAVGTEATGIAITGSPQMLDSAYGISIDFGATTGHTLNDKWTGTATAVNTDTGLFSNRNAGNNYTHVGVFFDVSENKWTFLNAYDSEPGQTINVANGTLGTLKAATYEGNLTGNVTGQVSDVSNHTSAIRGYFSAGGNLSYNSGTGEFSYTDSDRTPAQIRGLFSGAGNISYNSSTGEFSYTDSDRTPTQIKNLFSGAGDISYNSATGEFSYTDSDRTPAQIKGLFSAAGDISYNSSTGEFSYTDSDRTPAQIKGLFSAAGDISYNSSTGEFSYTDSDRTPAQIRGLFSSTGDISYNSSTGEFSYTDSDRTPAQIKGLFSAAGDISYNSSTGEFSYTDSDRTPTQIRGLFSGAGDISYNSSTGEISYTDSDRTPAQIRGLFSGSNGVDYNNTTGAITADQGEIRGFFSAGGDLSYNSGTGEFSYTDSDRTPAQIKGLFSAAGDISYNSSTGEFSYTDSDRTPAQIKGLFSAAGDISYNSSTGEFSYTDSDRTPAQIRGLFSGGTGISYDANTGEITSTVSGADSAAVLSLFSAGGDLSYNSGTGEFSYTDSDRTPAQIKGLFSAGGDLSYNSTTGEFSYTDSDRTPAQIRGLFSGGTGISYDNNTGVITSTVTGVDSAAVLSLFSAGAGLTFDNGQYSITSLSGQMVMDALKTVDSDNSGLNADTLDGQEGTYYRINVYDASGTLLN